MLDVRRLGWFRFWTPLGWWRYRGHIVRAGVLADRLHNLPSFSSVDFDHFDEARFWRDFDYALCRCPNLGLERYRERFAAMTDQTRT